MKIDFWNHTYKPPEPKPVKGLAFITKNLEVISVNCPDVIMASSNNTTVEVFFRGKNQPMLFVMETAKQADGIVEAIRARMG